MVPTTTPIVLHWKATIFHLEFSITLSLEYENNDFLGWFVRIFYDDAYPGFCSFILIGLSIHTTSPMCPMISFRISLVRQTRGSPTTFVHIGIACLVY